MFGVHSRVGVSRISSLGVLQRVGVSCNSSRRTYQAAASGDSAAHKRNGTQRFQVMPQKAHIPPSYIKNQNSVTINGVTISKGPFNNYPVSCVSHPTVSDLEMTVIWDVSGNVKGFRDFLRTQFPLHPVLVNFSEKQCRTFTGNSYSIAVEGDHRKELRALLKKVGF